MATLLVKITLNTQKIIFKYNFPFKAIRIKKFKHE